MKKNLHFSLYGIALIIILIPIVMTEALHSPLGQPWETIILSIGLLLLLIGKFFALQRKRKQTGESIFLDIVIIVCLLAMIVWMFVR